MAKYVTGSQYYYRKGNLYPPYSVVEIPDDEKPSITWTKHSPGVAQAAAEPAPSDITTMSEMQQGKKGKRPSDSSPI